MKDTFNVNMTRKEIENILNDNGIRTPFGWEIVLTMLFREHNANTCKIEGFGENAVLKFY